MVLLYGEASHQTFLSTTSYYWQISTGIIIPKEMLETFDLDDATKTSALAQLFRRPTLDTSPLDQFMTRNRNITKGQIRAIKKIRKESNVKTAEASAYWNKEDVKHTYGGYAVTYQLLSERYALMNASARQTRKEKVASMSYEEQERLRLRHNAMQVERKKRQRA